MGNLLKVLQCKEEVMQDSFLDFENALPTDDEREVYDRVYSTLSLAPGILTELQSYKGAGEVIRMAISNPSQPEKQADAWVVIIPLVQQLKEFFEFSKDLQKCEKELLGSLTCEPHSVLQHLETKQALAKQLAEILHFTLKFDDLKMNMPSIQNDLSYFRRTMSRRGKNMPPGIDFELGNCISTEIANEMSLFYADHTPMLKALGEGAIRFVEENKATLAPDRIDEVLSTMAQICKVMLENPGDSRFQMGVDSISFCVGVMVGLIILYDHVHKEGAFVKGSKIDVKGCIKALKEHSNPQEAKTKSLINALRYTTKHFNDETTPKAIHKMLET